MIIYWRDNEGLLTSEPTSDSHGHKIMYIYIYTHIPESSDDEFSPRLIVNYRYYGE